MTILKWVGGRRLSQEIQLVAVQMRLSIEDYWTKEAFRRKIETTMAAVERAAAPGIPTLVVFPEDVGLMLVVQEMREILSGVDSVRGAITRSTRAFFWKALRYRLQGRLSWVPALFLSRHRLIAETYFDVFSDAARKSGVYLAAGSVALPPYRVVDGQVLWRGKPLGSRVYNTAFVFDPQGRVIGSQRKVYLTELEMQGALDLAAGNLHDLSVIATPLGTLGLAICLDCFQDDVANALAERGAQILVQPSANPAPWTPEQSEEWLESAYRRTCVQKLFTYAVNPMMTGSVFDVAFFGQSSIVGREGFLSQADSHDGESVLAVRVPHP